jgi:glycerol-3-phosphate O-acyltransferase / dihydroxyacetone phosphate acyltransferase
MIFQRLIYLFLRVVVWFGIGVFYRRRIIVGREHLDFEGPAIIVANHPSTLMDVLNTCLHVRQVPFFLANYSLFKHPVSNWVLRNFFCIPVKRREDVAEGAERNNDAAFEQSFQHIEKKGILFIAAEGVSWMERWVRPFKSGAARIVLGTESRNDWKLGVKILPVGLSYSAPNLFRSKVLVHFGAPVTAESWAEANAENHEKAVEGFTHEIQQKVRALVLDTRDAAGQVFVEQLELLQKDKFPVAPAEYFDFRKKLIEQNIDNAALQSASEQYFDALAAAGISDDGLMRTTAQQGKAQYFRDAALLVLGFPLFALGYAFWWLPCFLPWLLAKKMNLYIGYDSNVKMLAGLITFPLALWGAFLAASHYLGAGYWAWLVLPALVLLGYFAEQYLDVAKRRQQISKAQRMLEKDAATVSALFEHRNRVFAQLQL